MSMLIYVIPYDKRLLIFSNNALSLFKLPKQVHFLTFVQKVVVIAAFE